MLYTFLQTKYTPTQQPHMLYTLTKSHGCGAHYTRAHGTEGIKEPWLPGPNHQQFWRLNSAIAEIEKTVTLIILGLQRRNKYLELRQISKTDLRNADKSKLENSKKLAAIKRHNVINAPLITLIQKSQEIKAIVD